MHLTQGLPPDNTPVTAPQFAAAMAAFAPFEPAPNVAVGVSGGPDSTAAMLLAHQWAEDNGGTASALIVDHGLRADAATEATQVKAALDARGIATHILPWTGPRPTGDIQAAARAARHRLLLDWCAANGVLHLILAHHRDDQVETFLLRLGRGSGVTGLAAMSSVVERPAARLLRPLLDVPRARLQATARAHGAAWVDDPSNTDPRHARARLRAALPALGDDNLTADRLAATAARLGRARAALDDATATLLGRAATLHPAGFIRLDSAQFTRVPPEIALRALGRCLATVSGSQYTPRFESLQRLHDGVNSASLRTQTLGGCRISRRADRTILISREAAAMAPPTPITGKNTLWDDRFHVFFANSARDLQVAALGTGRGQLAGYPGLTAIPAPIRPVLPAIWRSGRVLAVPHADFLRPRLRPTTLAGLKVAFSPVHALSSGRFTIV